MLRPFQLLTHCDALDVVAQNLGVVMAAKDRSWWRVATVQNELSTRRACVVRRFSPLPERWRLYLTLRWRFAPPLPRPLPPLPRPDISMYEV